VKERCWVGIDVGSITCKVVVIDEADRVLGATYRRTRGRIVKTVKDGLTEVGEALRDRVVAGAATTGSARRLVAALIHADVVKNEITAHARAALALHPDVRTILEIGGEDSKIVLLRDGVPVDFAMNTVCAAGTGAFLDQLAGRLEVPVEELERLAVASTRDVAIAGRCTVFAESDVIFKQQTGQRIEDIVAGVCRALVRNYLNDVGKGKAIEVPILFLGGVRAGCDGPRRSRNRTSARRRSSAPDARTRARWSGSSRAGISSAIWGAGASAGRRRPAGHVKRGLDLIPEIIVD